MSDCLFCNILKGEAEASFVHKDDLVTGFMDIQPVNPGHVLIVPNQHASYLADLPAETGAQMFRVAQRISAALRSSDIPCDGINFFLADGKAAGQEIFHVHLHVFPRFVNDGFGLKVGPNYYNRPSRPELQDTAMAISKKLERT